MSFSAKTVRVVASNKDKDMFAKRFNQRRQKVERVRSLTVRRINDDLHLIAKRELEFAQELLSNAFPFDVQWDKAFMDLSPIKFAYKYTEDDYEVVSIDKDLDDDGSDGSKLY